jgi:hypothetical protein
MGIKLVHCPYWSTNYEAYEGIEYLNISKSPPQIQLVNTNFRIT